MRWLFAVLMALTGQLAFGQTFDPDAAFGQLVEHTNSWVRRADDPLRLSMVDAVAAGADRRTTAEAVGRALGLGPSEALLAVDAVVLVDGWSPETAFDRRYLSASSRFREVLAVYPDSEPIKVELMTVLKGLILLEPTAMAEIREIAGTFADPAAVLLQIGATSRHILELALDASPGHPVLLTSLGRNLGAPWCLPLYHLAYDSLSTRNTPQAREMMVALLRFEASDLMERGHVERAAATLDGMPDWVVTAFLEPAPATLSGILEGLAYDWRLPDGRYDHLYAVAARRTRHRTIELLSAIPWEPIGAVEDVCSRSEQLRARDESGKLVMTERCHRLALAAASASANRREGLDRELIAAFVAPAADPFELVVAMLEDTFSELMGAGRHLVHAELASRIGFPDAATHLLEKAEWKASGGVRPTELDGQLRYLPRGLRDDILAMGPDRESVRKAVEAALEARTPIAAPASTLRELLSPGVELSAPRFLMNVPTDGSLSPGDVIGPRIEAVTLPGRAEPVRVFGDETLHAIAETTGPLDLGTPNALWYTTSNDGGDSWSEPLFTGVTTNYGGFMGFVWRDVPRSTTQSIVVGDALEIPIVTYGSDAWTLDIQTARVPVALLSADTDADGWTDLVEHFMLTDPGEADSDGDGIVDSEDRVPNAAFSPQTPPDPRLVLMRRLVDKRSPSGTIVALARDVFEFIGGWNGPARLIAVDSRVSPKFLWGRDQSYASLEVFVRSPDGTRAYAIWEKRSEGGSLHLTWDGQSWQISRGQRWIS